MVYKDARFAFFVILAFMVLVVIIWGRTPSPDDVALDPSKTGTSTGAASSSGAPASSAPEPHVTTVATPPGSPSPSHTLPPADIRTDAAPPTRPRVASASSSVPEPSFPFPKDPTRLRATMTHDGPPPEPPRVALAEDKKSALPPAPPKPADSPTASTPPTAAPPSATATPAAPKPLAYHVVAKGETYRILAQRYYKDASKWRLIYQANNQIDQERLAIGTKLVIPALPGTAPTHPSATTATAAKPTEAPKTTPPATAKAPAPTTTPKPTGQRSFTTVQSGENFFRIALRVYKNGGYWRKLYEHNRALLPDPSNPNSLRAGTKIETPQFASVK
jgi:nucleoid-associated protein YgaU